MNLFGFLAQWKMDWSTVFSMVSVLDVVVLLIFILGIFFGLKSGLTKVLPQFIEVIVAQVVSLELCNGISDWIHVRIPIPPLLIQLSIFVALVFLSFLATRFIFQILGLIAKLEFQSLLNSTGGAVLNGIRLVFLFSLLSTFLLMFPFAGIKEIYTRSISGHYLETLSQKVHDGVISFVPQNWRLLQPVPVKK